MLQVVIAALVLHAAPVQAQTTFEPTVGQEGKDVVWVPTPQSLVEKMLDMAKVTPKDFVMDLGSGDGRNIIAAAKRGARAVGVEYNPEMVALSRRNAEAAGVADKATFVQGDMYEADISKATVLALFLLPHNLEKLRDKFFALDAGTRIVANTFAIPGWVVDQTEKIEGDCMSWCTSLLYIVPAKVQGKWRLPDGELALQQDYQTVQGSLTSGRGAATVEGGNVHGDQIKFRIGAVEYSGRVNGSTMSGTKSGSESGSWKATRAQ
jgi:SAM-dependent methyltransferase